MFRELSAASSLKSPSYDVHCLSRSTVLCLLSSTFLPSFTRFFFLRVSNSLPLSAPVPTPLVPSLSFGTPFSPLPRLQLSLFVPTVFPLGLFQLGHPSTHASSPVGGDFPRDENSEV